MKIRKHVVLRLHLKSETYDLTATRAFILLGLFCIGVFAAWKTYKYIWSRSVIIVDGIELSVAKKLTTPEMVTAELKNMNVTLSPKDIILPPVSESFFGRKKVQIIRVTERIIKQEDEPEFKVIWEKKNTGNLRPVKLVKGTLRRKINDVKIIYHDSTEYGRQIIDERSIKKIIYRLVLLDEKDEPEKTYDLSKCKKIKMIATAYYPGDPLAWKDGTITFLGQKMQRGIIAVDPKVIPLKTRLYVPGYGYGYAGDTGSAIKGKRVDLGVNNAKEEKSWMHKKAIVYVLEESNEY